MRPAPSVEVCRLTFHDIRDIRVSTGCQNQYSISKEGVESFIHRPYSEI